MRIVLMGTGPFAVPSFERLLDSPEHEVPAVVTRPLTSQGRSAKIGKSVEHPVRALAESRGLSILDPPDINDRTAQQLLAGLMPELLVVCDYGQILSSTTLSLTALGGINLHGSLLPKYRGAAPVQWAILNGESETGVTVIHMTAKLDAGPCLVQRRVPIGPEETAGELEQRLARLGVEAVLEAIALLDEWDGTTPLGIPQDPSQASRAPRMTKRDGHVDWSQPAQRIANQARALKPWPGTYTFWRRPDEPLRLILERVVVQEQPAAAPAGSVVKAEGSDLWVATGDRLLAIAQLQPAGKRVLSAAEFLRGYPLRAGDQLS